MLNVENLTVVAKSVADRIRYPEQIFTDGYLNDPVQFRPDERFTPESIVEQLDVMPNRAERDLADFVQVDFNKENSQYLSINLFSPVWSRTSYNKVISPQRRAFEQLR